MGAKVSIFLHSTKIKIFISFMILIINKYSVWQSQIYGLFLLNIIFAKCIYNDMKCYKDFMKTIKQRTGIKKAKKKLAGYEIKV